jgi:hypothetical protein
MSYTVDFNTISTIGLECSPVAAAVAGLRAHEARYFKNKHDHLFTVEPASEANATIDWVHRILKQERDIVSRRDRSRRPRFRSRTPESPTSSTRTVSRST